MRRLGRAVAVAAVALAPVAAPSAATAKPLDPWFGAWALDEHQQDVAGQGVRIAMTDGATNLDAPGLRVPTAAGDTLVTATSYPTALYAGHDTAAPNDSSPMVPWLVGGLVILVAAVAAVALAVATVVAAVRKRWRPSRGRRPGTDEPFG